MKTSIVGINLIKKFEGCILTAYPDPATGGDPWTIGYGNTFYENGNKVLKGDSITQEHAEKLLLNLLPKFENIVNNSITATLKQNQFDALVTFVWNTGKMSDTIVGLINNHGSNDDIYKFWTTHYIMGDGKVMQGLVNRRKAEADLFIQP
jgi:lysozyme